MTKEEAIKILHGAIKKPNTKDGYLGQALDIAIKALEQEPCEDEIILTKDEYGKLLSSEFDNGYAKGYREALEQEPKTGKWKLVQVGKRVDLCCANCGAVRVEEVAYNYTIDQLNKFFKEDYKELLKMPDMSYCPCCGTKMENEDI